MFLRLENYKLPENVEWSYTPDEARQKYGGEVVPLKDAGWLEKHVADIEAIFKTIGIESPLEQKLVEPTLLAFGGPDHAKVNWQKVKDYFKWEAASMTKNPKAWKLQEEADKKYGHVFNHYAPYTDF